MPLYTKRPEAIKERISHVFEAAKARISSWNIHDGRPYYDPCQIDIFKLLMHQVSHQPTQKIFNILDIGTGSGDSLRKIAEDIKLSDSIPDDVRFNLIGIRAEDSYKDKFPEKREEGKCFIYDYSGFNAEVLIAELNARGHEGVQFDIIMSFWCMRHLVDPMGTFDQAYEITRPETGFLLMDGFWFQLEGEGPCNKSPPKEREKMITLELSTKKANASLLHSFYEDAGSFDQFMIRKGDLPLELPFEYTEDIIIDPSLDIAQHYSICTFKKLRDLKYEMKLSRELSRGLIGDRELFDEIMECRTVDNWKPAKPPLIEYWGDFEIVETPLGDAASMFDSSASDAI